MWVKTEKEGLQMSLKHFISLKNTKVIMENIYIFKFQWYCSYLCILSTLNTFEIVHIFK